MEDEILETHLEETKQIIIEKTRLNPIDESGKNKIRLFAERLRNVESTRFFELANERLQLFEATVTNLGFPPDVVKTMVDSYKQKLIQFIRTGLREYLLKERG